MDKDQLLRAARVIVARNLTSNVLLVLVDWLPGQAKLVLSYLTLQPPREEDREEAEVSMTELLAEFPEVADCETVCAQRSGSDPASGHTVFLSNHE